MNAEEIMLEKESYEMEIPVKIYERVQISGYIRTKEDENKDAAVIVFDLGDVEIDEKILRVHGLVKSKIGIFKYLPVGKKFQLWNASIFIPEKIDVLKVKFFKWKNKSDISIGKDMLIVKDYAYSMLFRELRTCQKNQGTAV